jgi:hypothetical protein
MASPERPRRMGSRSPNFHERGSVARLGAVGRSQVNMGIANVHHGVACGGLAAAAPISSVPVATVWMLLATCSEAAGTTLPGVLFGDLRRKIAVRQPPQGCFRYLFSLVHQVQRAQAATRCNSSPEGEVRSARVVKPS